MLVDSSLKQARRTPHRRFGWACKFKLERAAMGASSETCPKAASLMYYLHILHVYIKLLCVKISIIVNS